MLALLDAASIGLPERRTLRSLKAEPPNTRGSSRACGAPGDGQLRQQRLILGMHVLSRPAAN
jgi:hypothetical protein